MTSISRRCSTQTSPSDSDASSRAALITRSVISELSTAMSILSYIGLTLSQLSRDGFPVAHFQDRKSGSHSPGPKSPPEQGPRPLVPGLSPPTAVACAPFHHADHPG